MIVESRALCPALVVLAENKNGLRFVNVEQ